jgi:thiosulfate reductase cytochrome b subunit
MTAATERKILRWTHLVLSIPIIGYIYGPVAEIPEAVVAVRFVFFPIVILSGLWMWKGQWLKKKF